jgi:signal transduction histidine kinase
MPPADRAASPRGLWRAFGRTGLSVRLAVLSALLAALVMGATFVALSVQVRKSTRQLFAAELTNFGRTLVGLQRDSRRHLIRTAALLSESPTLRSAIATYRVERQSGGPARPDLTATVEQELERLGHDLPGGALLATDEEGRVFAGYARGTTTPLAGTDLSSLSAVRNALDPTLQTTSDAPYLSGLEVDGAYYGVGVAPLILDGYTIGTIVFGERVDSSLVTALRRDFQGDVVISAGPRIVSSTLPQSESLIAAGDPGQTGEPLTLGKREFLVASIPLGSTQRGTPLRITLLQPLTAAVESFTSTLLPHFLLYGVLAVLLAALGASLLSRSLLRPLTRFILFMRRGAEHERLDRVFDARDASRELRILSESYNRLMAALGGKRVELERRSTELAQANEVLTDEIRQRERVEHALRESEAQLRQSQKLEAIGTLAGGIAHDFNNMLTVISGFTQMAMSTLGKDHAVAPDLKQVSDAANSAARLTHQLLAFSRKQVLKPRVLDLEEVVGGMEVMLRRLIGSHVELKMAHVGRPARIKADPGQLEQVLLNLAVNARDAMPHGGTLTVTTGSWKDQSGVEKVILQVRDTGVGIRADVRDRIFEPFFTTKEVGKGTGLGLSTVYGIIAQSGGTIEVDSIPGAGTTFTVRFPVVSELLLRPDGEIDAELPRGTETVLLVDDEASVRELARRTLEGCGYTVIAAQSGVEALTQAKLAGRIDVLLTDIVMPQLTGPQLVERYLEKYPAPCIVYMTGYVDDHTIQLELQEDVLLLRKPFSALELARVVRASLDGRNVPAWNG